MGKIRNAKKNSNVFIASLPRSGSTLLGMILNQHNDCFYTGESFYWKKLNPKNEVCTCGVKGCNFLKNIYNKIKLDSNILKISDVVVRIDAILQNEDEKKTNKTKNNFLRDIPQCCVGFESLVNIYRQKTQKRIIIDSSSNIILAKELMSINKWKVIILTRDPRGIISSLKEAARRHQGIISKKIWCEYLIDFAKRANSLSSQEDTLTVKYEDLCNNTNSTVKNICNFLNIKFDPLMLQYRQNKGHILMANRMRFDEGENIKEDVSWRSSLSKNELGVICNNKKLINAYSKLGYNIKLDI